MKTKHPPLTDRQCSTAKPKARPYELPDRYGLSLRVHPSGVKTWAYHFAVDGRGRRMTLGSYPAMSLAEARSKHAVLRADVKRGIDPALAAQDAEIARRQAPTVADILGEFDRVKLQGQKSGPEQKRLIERDCGSLLERKAASVTMRDIVLLLDEVGARAPVLRNRLQGALNKLFRFACARGILTANPATGIERLAEASRDRVLTDDEIRSLWQALEGNTTELYRLTRLALKAILLTGQRPGEVTGLRWDEIRGDLWILPATRSKTGRENQTPILPMFREVLEQARQVSWDSEFVFRSSRMQNRPVNVCALGAAVRRHKPELGIAGPPWRPHDLRRTVRTRLSELGVSEIVAEKILGHTLGGMMAVYDRHLYLPEKRQALAMWEQELRRILKLSQPAQVVVAFPERS